MRMGPGGMGGAMSERDLDRGAGLRGMGPPNLPFPGGNPPGNIKALFLRTTPSKRLLRIECSLASEVFMNRL
jgi:hypothetical protein